ncbi:MAG: flagellar hook-associated protein FlgL [Panacagrimonas sp.]
MRISTAALHHQGIANILRNQAALSKTQNELALGTRLVSAKDDPAAWARAAGLDQRLSQLAQYRDNGSVARHRLGLEETALSSANDALNRIRELAVQANSGTQSADSRRAIASEMQARLDELLAIANTDDGEGRYLFGGSADGSRPFSIDVSGATYAGGASARVLDIGPERSLDLGDAGDAVFQNLLSGNGTFSVAGAATNTGSAQLGAASLVDATSWDGGTYALTFNGGNYEVRDAGNALVASSTYQSGSAIRFRGVDLTLSGTPADGDRFSVTPSQPQDVFATVQKLIGLVQSAPASAAARAQEQTALFGAIEELDAGLNRMSDVRATVGNRLLAVDQAADQIETFDVQAQSALSELRDLDYAEATGRLNLQLTALQAAQQSYLRVQGMSLFDYLG